MILTIETIGACIVGAALMVVIYLLAGWMLDLIGCGLDDEEGE